MTTTSLYKVICVLALFTITSGCATVTRGTKDTLVINSTPSGADIKIYRINSNKSPITGNTPGTFKLARKGEYRVELVKPGYKTVEAIISNKLVGIASAGIAGRAIASGGLAGVIIDGQTGASKNLTPNPLEVVFEAGEGKVLFEDPAQQVSEDTNLSVKPQPAATK